MTRLVGRPNKTKGAFSVFIHRKKNKKETSVQIDDSSSIKFDVFGVDCGGGGSGAGAGLVEEDP